MHDFQNESYATTREVANILGCSDTTLKNKISEAKLPIPTETDDNNRRYYSADYIVEALARTVQGRTKVDHQRAYLAQVVIRINGAPSLTNSFKQAILDKLRTRGIWPVQEGSTKPAGQVPENGTEPDVPKPSETK
jgi:hypothetical protein